MSIPKDISEMVESSSLVEREVIWYSGEKMTNIAFNVVITLF